MRFLLSTFLLLAVSAVVLPLSSSSSSFVSCESEDGDGEIDVSESSSSPSSSSEEQEVEVDDEDTTNLYRGYTQQQYTLETLPSSGDLFTTIYFPSLADSTPPSSSSSSSSVSKFFVGEEVHAIVGVSNTGSRPYNLTYMTGSLHSPYDFSYYIQNFTVSLIGTVVDAGSEISVDFKFKTDPNLEPLQFQLEAYFLYNTTDEREVFRTTFFNETIELVEKNSDFTTRTLFSYLMVLLVLGAIGYFVYESKVTKVVRRTQSKAKKVAEWDAPVYTPAEKSKPVARRRAGGSKKN